MKLNIKKALAARALNVGLGRIIFNNANLTEIKEAITKQDMLDLHSRGAILIRDINGRKAVEKRRNRRRAGSVRKKVKNSKTKYIIITRKLRSHLFALKKQGKMNRELFTKIRQEIRASSFRSLTHLKERINEEKVK